MTDVTYKIMNAEQEFVENCVSDETAIADSLVGRRIVSSDGYSMTLDDGTILEFYGNEGCGGCPGGHYEIEKFLSEDEIGDNIITAVHFEESSNRNEAYSIYVIADNTKINMVTFSGDDGSGYYGSGYSIQIKKAS